MATSTQQQILDKIEPVVKVTEMDHIAMRVKDVDATLRFYHQILGLPVERLDLFRAGKVPFPSVRVNADTVIDLFPFDGMTGDAIEPRNLDHYCIVVEPTDLAQVREKLEALGVEMAPVAAMTPENTGGPLARWGAHGDGTSLYVYDPDGSIVELRYY